MVFGKEEDGLAARESFRGNIIKAVRPTRINPTPSKILPVRLFDLDLALAIRLRFGILRLRIVILDYPFSVSTSTSILPA